jgi:LacI family transcriptional regulator
MPPDNGIVLFNHLTRKREIFIIVNDWERSQFIPPNAEKQTNSMTRLSLTKIAEIANVSRSTVSRVINEQPDVKPQVRQRVLQIIEETGYLPHTGARSLRKKNCDVVAFVICSTVNGLFTDPYYPVLTKGIALGLNRHNKTLALFLEGDPDTIYPRLARPGQFDGILIQVGKSDDYLIKKMKQTEIPFMVLGRPAENNVSFIDADNVSGGYQATLHLIQRKHERIATICASLSSTTGLDRHQGYCNALTERGIPYREELVVEADFSEAGGYYAMQRLLPHHPDAVFAASDLMARGAIRAIREAGLLVPQDIAIVGYDDLPPAVSAVPHLTTIRQPIARLGYTAVELLLDMIDHKQQSLQRIMLDVELVVRDSSGERLL